MKGLKIMTEMQKLDKYLTEHNIKHTYKRRWPNMEQSSPEYREGKHHDGGYQIMANGDNGEYLWDAICGYGSFGFETGTIEIMGCIVPECVNDSVEGHLTANEVIERIEKYYASNGLVINN